MYYLALDIGGTKTSAALFREDGTMWGDVLRRKSRTYDGENAVYENSRLAVEELLAQRQITIREVLAAGVGGPGPLDAETGVILHAPMMGWHNFPLAGRLKADFGVPVFLDNDGNLGALAEQCCGLARGKKAVGYMTVSTGIGGGLVLDGKIYHGAKGGGGEFGHLSIDPDGPRCPCGNFGCLEMYASGTAIARRLRAGREAGADSKVFAVSETPGCAELAQAAEAGDVYALEMFHDLGRKLGLGLANIFNLLDLDIIVLGGGVTKARRWYEAEMLETITQRCMHGFQPERIAYSEMNDNVVLYGAYWLAKESISK